MKIPNRKPNDLTTVRFIAQLKNWDKKNPLTKTRLKKKGFREPVCVGFGEGFNSWVNFGGVILHPWKKLLLIEYPTGRSVYENNWASARIEGEDHYSFRNGGCGIDVEKFYKPWRRANRWATTIDYEAEVKTDKDMVTCMTYRAINIKTNHEFSGFIKEIEKKPWVSRSYSQDYIYKLTKDEVFRFLEIADKCSHSIIGDVNPSKEHQHLQSEAYTDIQKINDEINKLWTRMNDLKAVRWEIQYKNKLDMRGNKTNDPSEYTEPYKEEEIHKPEQKCLYLMKNKRTGHYKIGISNNPKIREGTLQSQEPEVALVGSWEKQSDNERDWHNYFADYRLRGEWFELTKTQIKMFCHACTSGKGPPLVTA